MKMAAEGHLTTEALMWNQNVDEKTISGMSSGDFRYDQINSIIRFNHFHHNIILPFCEEMTTKKQVTQAQTHAHTHTHTHRERDGRERKTHLYIKMAIWPQN